MDNYQCHIWIDNKTSELLTLKKHETSWGEFREGPVERVARMSMTGDKAWRATGTRFLPGGCEGDVVYQIGERTGHEMRIHFTVPASPLGRNQLDVEVPTGYSWRETGWTTSGATGSATIVLTRSQD